MDPKYLEIKVKNVKNDLDAAVEFFNTDQDTDRTEEYINDCIRTLNELIVKMK